jgi:hypothetical protein
MGASMFCIIAMGYVAALSHVKIGKRQLRLDPVEVVTSSCGASGNAEIPPSGLCFRLAPRRKEFICRCAVAHRPSCLAIRLIFMPAALIYLIIRNSFSSAAVAAGNFHLLHPPCGIFGSALSSADSLGRWLAQHPEVTTVVPKARRRITCVPWDRKIL